MGLLLKTDHFIDSSISTLCIYQEPEPTVHNHPEEAKENHSVSLNAAAQYLPLWTVIPYTLDLILTYIGIFSLAK